ncbi:hypothetical protein GCM10028820_31730 [Tessaracoccus terricola]
MNVTALMSLGTRLALARIALHARADQADVERLAPVIRAGVDLLVLGSAGDDARDADVLGAFREVYAHVPLLLATANGDCAKDASADVVHLEKPGWKLWGSYPKGHQWSLLGRNACDARTVRRPGGEWQYLFVGPLGADDVDSPPLAEAVATQRPFTRDALPWFVLGDFGAETIAPFLAAGARRVALTDTVLDDPDPVARVAAVRAAVERAWEGDGDAKAYRLAATAF